jgi:hypothetical protein
VSVPGRLAGPFLACGLRAGAEKLCWAWWWWRSRVLSVVVQLGPVPRCVPLGVVLLKPGSISGLARRGQWGARRGAGRRRRSVALGPRAPVNAAARVRCWWTRSRCDSGLCSRRPWTPAARLRSRDPQTWSLAARCSSSGSPAVGRSGSSSADDTALARRPGGPLPREAGLRRLVLGRPDLARGPGSSPSARRLHRSTRTWASASSRRRSRSDVVVDIAEVPALRAFPARCLGGSGRRVPDAEQRAYRDRLCPALLEAVAVRLGGRPVELELVGSALSFPPGDAGPGHRPPGVRAAQHRHLRVVDQEVVVTDSMAVRPVGLARDHRGRRRRRAGQQHGPVAQSLAGPAQLPGGPAGRPARPPRGQASVVAGDGVRDRPDGGTRDRGPAGSARARSCSADRPRRHAAAQRRLGLAPWRSPSCSGRCTPLRRVTARPDGATWWGGSGTCGAALIGASVTVHPHAVSSCSACWCRSPS